MSGFEAVSQVICGKFMGYQFIKCGENVSGLTDVAAGKLNAKVAASAGKGQFPSLTSEQIQVLAETLGEILTETYRERVMSRRKAQLDLIEFTHYNPDGGRSTRRFMFIPPDGAKVAGRLKRIGLSVASRAGGFIVSAGPGLLDPDFASGVRAMWQNYNDPHWTGEGDLLRDNKQSRRDLRDLTRQIDNQFK
jgi:hypothetical protein